MDYALPLRFAARSPGTLVVIAVARSFSLLESLLRRSLMASRVLKHLLARYALPRMSMLDFAAER